MAGITSDAKLIKGDEWDTQNDPECYDQPVGFFVSWVNGTVDFQKFFFSNANFRILGLIDARFPRTPNLASVGSAQVVTILTSTHYFILTFSSYTKDMISAVGYLDTQANLRKPNIIVGCT